MYKCNFKAIEFPKGFQHKKQEPHPNIKWLSMFAPPQEVSTGNLACISFMFRSSWFHLKRRGSVREPGTEALSRSRSSFVSNLPPRRATCLQTPPGPFKKVAQEKSTKRKTKLWENPTLISWGSFLASQSKGYDPSHHPINDANSLCLSVLWDSTTSDSIIFLDQYYQSYSCTPPSPM